MMQFTAKAGLTDTVQVTEYQDFDASDEWAQKNGFEEPKWHEGLQLFKIKFGPPFRAIVVVHGGQFGGTILVKSAADLLQLWMLLAPLRVESKLDRIERRLAARTPVP